MTNFENFKNYKFIKFQKCYLWLYLNSTLFNLSNDTKITQNGVRKRKLWAKQNGVAVYCEKKFAQCENSYQCENFALSENSHCAKFFF